MKEIGRLENVEVKDVWDNKETAFTKWLAENPDVLGDAIGISIPTLRAEHSTGSFRVDLIGTDESDGVIVVENQFGASNHDHLGKLVTYLAASKAKTAVWIVENARAEHVNAISLLNQLQSMSFYLLGLEAVKIGDSLPAPKLTLIIGPSEEIESINKETSETGRELDEIQNIRKEFWNSLLTKLRGKKISLHSNLSPSLEHYMMTSAGKNGLGLCYVIRKNDARVELYIDRYNTEEKNMEVFRHFLKRKTAIETEFGDSLDWQELEGKIACRIAKILTVGGLRDTDKWNEIQDAMINAMTRLEKALKPYIDSLNI